MQIWSQILEYMHMHMCINEEIFTRMNQCVLSRVLQAISSSLSGV